MGFNLSEEDVNFILGTVIDAKEEILRLANKVAQAVEDIRMLGRMGQNICPVCAHYNHGAGNPKQCPRALKCEDCFEWRGMKHD